MPAHLCGAASLLAATCLWTTSAFAAPAPAYDDLLRAASGAPTLAESAAELDAAEARLRQARAWRNPDLSLELENAAGSGPYRDLDAAEATVSIGQTLELGGKRQARIAVAGGELATAKARSAVTAVDFPARLAVAYAEAEAAQAKADLAGEMLAAAEADALAARLLAEAGKEAPLRSVQAAADEQSARADLKAAEAAGAEAFARLTALAGAETPFDHIATGLLDRPIQVAPTSGASPAVALAQAERDTAQARLRLERRQAMPELRLSAGLRRFEETGEQAAVLGVSTPLPLFDRNRGGVQAAAAEARAAEARLARARLDAEADRVALASRAGGASALAEAADASERAAAEAYRLARLGYQAGRLPLLELTATRRGLAQARARAVEARLDRVRLEAETARAAGRTPFGVQP